MTLADLLLLLALASAVFIACRLMFWRPTPDDADFDAPPRRDPERAAREAN